MTLAATATAANTSAGASATPVRHTVLDVVESALVVVAFAGLWYALIHSGGRDKGAVDVALTLIAPSFLMTMPWRRLSQLEIWLCAAVPVAAVTVPLVTTLGVSGVKDLNAYLLAAVTFAVIRSYARDHHRRRLVATCVLSLGAIEFAEVLPVWFGQNDASTDIVGTFYWHNQFGIFAGATAVFAATLAVRSRHVEDLLAWLVAPTLLATTYLSHSRASEVATGGVLAVLAVRTLWRSSWLVVGRLAAIVGLAAGTAALFIAAVASPHIVAAPGSVASLTGESAGQASGTRLTFWRAALRIFWQAPVVGHGFGSFFVRAPSVQPVGSGISRWAHSGPLQALTDGGLLLGGPLLTGAGLAAVRFARNVRDAFRRPAELETVRLAATLAGSALLAHACMDFDWNYPVLLALLALMIALALPDAASRALGNTAPAERRIPETRVMAAALMIAACVFGSYLEHVYWRTTDRLNRADVLVSGHHSAEAVSLATHAMNRRAFVDPRPATWLVSVADTGMTVPAAVLRQALAEARDYSKLDAGVRPIWLRMSRELALSNQ